MVTDGVRSAPLGELGADFSRERLEERLGPWSEWRATRGEVLSRGRRFVRVEATLERRKEHWGRAVRLITESERRVARHDALRKELDRVERRLRKLVQEKLAPRATWDEARRLVGELVVAPQGELPASLRRGWRGLVLRWGRRGGLPVEVRRALEVDRELRRRLARSAPAARAAGRRLDRLRRRARAINPWRVREEARGELKDAARRVGQVIGVRSLVAQAAPGIGTALGLVRIARRVVRQMELDRGGGRER